MTALLSAERWTFLAEHLPISRATRVIDVGANPLDEPAYKPLMDAGLARVHGFEPQPEAYARLEAIKGAMETYHPDAIGDGGVVNFNIYGQSGLSSTLTLDERSTDFLGRNPKAGRLISQTPIQTRRLDDVDDLPMADLLKIDVQGAETQIMSSGPRTLEKVMAVITEIRFFPLYHEEPCTDPQWQLLGDMGLIFHKSLFTKSKMISNSRADRLRQRALRTQAIDGDAVFVRDLRDPDRLESENIAQLALLADAVFQSFDLTVHCLDILARRGDVTSELIDAYVDMLPPEVRK